MKVCKFGGSSLSDAKQIQKVVDIILADPDRRIIVVSAPGKRNKNDIKVTDLLINCAKAKISDKPGTKELQAVIDRFDAIREELGLPADIITEIGFSLKERLESDTSDKEKYIDALKAAGEDNCAKLIAAVLNHKGLKAQYLNPGTAGMILSNDYGHAKILPESYEKLAITLKAKNNIIVFPGFFGYTRQGEIVTFSRGGSDITGSILAAAVKADVYENFTDVDSVMAAEPSIVPDAQPIKEITFREMRELAYAGFHVLHDEAILPAVNAGVGICIKNINNPDSPGTKIVKKRKDSTIGKVTGIASSDGFSTIYVSKYLMNREIGFGRKFLQIFEEEGVSYEHMPSGIDNLSIILQEKFLSPDKEKKILNRIKKELKVDDVAIEHNLALIMVVGEGMRFTVGMASRATKALAEAKVNIEMMNQGSSEISMMFGVKALDRKKAVKSLYNEFFKKP